MCIDELENPTFLRFTLHEVMYHTYLETSAYFFKRYLPCQLSGFTDLIFLLSNLSHPVLRTGWLMLSDIMCFH